MQTERRRVVWHAAGIPGQPESMDRFRAFAETAAEMGATHVTVSDLPGARWQCEDPRDPHPQWASWPIWSMHNASLFKVAVPPALEPWLPADEASANLELIAERCRILRSLGLRATFAGGDPMWLPEGVYQAHPEWRGARGDLLRISRLPYFSPNVDHPDVLAMFRWSAAQLLKHAPEVDLYSVFTNDSTGGLNWTPSYPGPNGPDDTRTRPLPDRVVGFLSAVQDGARDAGCELDGHLQICGVSDPTAIRAALQPGQYVANADRDGNLLSVGAGGANCWFGNHVYPVVGIPKVFAFAEELESAFHGQARYTGVGFGPGVQALLVDICRAYQASPTSGPASRMAMLRGVAASRVGDDHAENLLTVWQQIERAVENIRHCRGKGYASLLLVGPGMMRWLTMPLVPDPTGLCPDEKQFWQTARVAKTEVEAVSYHSLLGTPGIIGSAAAWMARNSLAEAMRLAKDAAGGAEALAGKAVDESAEEELTAMSYSLRALACAALTCKNFIDYEEALAQRGPHDSEVVFRDPDYGSGEINRGSYELRLVARSEADNAVALATLVETAPAPVLALAPTDEEEDSFLFAPAVADQLRRKARIMMDHWPEYDWLYPSLPMVHARQGEVISDQ